MSDWEGEWIKQSCEDIHRLTEKKDRTEAEEDALGKLKRANFIASCGPFWKKEAAEYWDRTKGLAEQEEK